MTALPEAKNELPDGLMLEKPPFVPRMVMTNQLQVVMREVVNQWRNRKAFAGLLKYGIRPLDRLLFHGPPGNGKTMACYWMSRELGVPVYRVLCSHLHDMYVGETEKKVAGVLDFLNAHQAPAICLWDEVESIFIDRKVGSGSGGDRAIASATTIMLQALDRWQSPVLMVLATNLPDHLDAALLSRVEMRLEFPGPNAKQCEEMLAYWAELLHDHGGDEWRGAIAAEIQATVPTSFRELQQRIGFAAREWVAARIRKDGGKK